MREIHMGVKVMMDGHPVGGEGAAGDVPGRLSAQPGPVRGAEAQAAGPESELGAAVGLGPGGVAAQGAGVHRGPGLVLQEQRHPVGQEARAPDRKGSPLPGPQGLLPVAAQSAALDAAVGVFLRPKADRVVLPGAG
ncbi:MAG TPA: hypothetical protein DCZ01_12515, partial [Elusimicrobia bacterium]|nr:hypothetical protein [Elusimicrobiota bacterium]